MSRTAWIGIMIALGLALALRMVLPQEVCDLRPRADALEYDLSSSALAQRYGYALPLEERTYPPRYTIGYPLLTAVARTLFDSPRDPGFGVFVSILSGLLIVVFGAMLAHEIGGNRAAIAAALLLALSPLQIFHSRQVMSDAAALALLLATLVLALRWARSPQYLPRIAAAIGLIAAFGATVRITNGLAIPFLLVLVLTRPFGEPGARTKAVIAFTMGCVIGIAPQLLVNRLQHGSLARSGYSFWIPSIYGSDAPGEEGNAFAIGVGSGSSSYGEYALQLCGYEALRRDAARLGFIDLDGPSSNEEQQRKEAYARLPRDPDRILFDRGLEPAVVYPFPIALLALLGVGMRGRGWNVARAARAMRVLLVVAAAFFVFYGAYSFRELRFLLPVQALLLIAAARVFATKRRPLFASAWILAGLALISALNDLSAAAKHPQSRLPYGRTNEESLTLRWIAQEVEPNAIIAVRTHSALFEREILARSSCLWVPIGRDEHRLRIENLELEANAPLRPRSLNIWSPDRGAFRPFQIDLDQRVIDLMGFGRDVVAGARTLDETLRREAVGHLRGLPLDALEAATRTYLEAQLARWDSSDEALVTSIVQLTLFAVLHSFAHDLDGLANYLESEPKRPAYLSDLYLFEYGFYEAHLRQILMTGRVPLLQADGTPADRSLVPSWKGLEKVSEFHRPGFPAQLTGHVTAFSLYRFKRS